MRQAEDVLPLRNFAMAKTGIVSNKPIFMEVFLLLPVRIKPRGTCGGALRFFERLWQSLHALAEEPVVFFSAKDAFVEEQYLREHCYVLRAFVPDQAIQGRHNALTLKRTTLKSAFIHGCYLQVQPQECYLKNPDFVRK